MSGKGDKPRHNLAKYGEGWQRVFGKKKGYPILTGYDRNGNVVVEHHGDWGEADGSTFQLWIEEDDDEDIRPN